MQHASIQGRVRGGARGKDSEATREIERDMQHASIQGRVRGGEREKDREATREIETCNTSNQGRVRERERVTMTEQH